MGKPSVFGEISKQRNKGLHSSKQALQFSPMVRPVSGLGALDTMTSLCKAKYNDGPEPKWGDRTLGLKTQRAIAKREAELAAEAAKRAKY